MTGNTEELLAAERESARKAGRQYAVELDLDTVWSSGAPLPFLVASGPWAAVIFHLTGTDEETGVIVFESVRDVWLGGVNDEALEGHPLFGAGLNFDGAHEVLNSEWITEAERRNSVHELHRGGWHQRMKHYVLCFEDETLECLAGGLSTERHAGGYADTALSVAARLLPDL